jgi:hypothetical protein
MSSVLTAIGLLAVIALAIWGRRLLINYTAKRTVDRILADVRSGKTSRPREYKLGLEMTADALVIHELSGKEPNQTTLNWSEITRAQLFKRDLWTTDMICLWLERADGTGFELNEEDFQGWNELLEQLPERLPGSLENWWSDVAFPAFATNEITIFQRGNLAAS